MSVINQIIQYKADFISCTNMGFNLIVFVGDLRRSFLNHHDSFTIVVVIVALCTGGGNPHSLISTLIHSTFSINVSIYIDTAECFHKLYLGVREAEGQQSDLNLTYTDANKSSICAAMFHSVTGL